MLIFAEANEADAAVGMSLALILFLCLLGFLFEMIPTWIAILRGHPNWIPIAIVNFFFSWTVIGWIVCLAWSFSAIQQKSDVHVHVNRRRRRDDDD